MPTPRPAVPNLGRLRPGSVMSTPLGVGRNAGPPVTFRPGGFRMVGGPFPLRPPALTQRGNPVNRLAGRIASFGPGYR